MIFRRDGEKTLPVCRPSSRSKRRRGAISKGGGDCGVEANVYFTMELLLQKVPIEAIDLGIKKKKR
jgi:hypothetical protein